MILIYDFNFKEYNNNGSTTTDNNCNQATFSILNLTAHLLNNCQEK